MNRCGILEKDFQSRTPEGGMHFASGHRKIYLRVSLNTVQKEIGVLYRAHISHIPIASHRLEIVFY